MILYIIIYYDIVLIISFDKNKLKDMLKFLK